MSRSALAVTLLLVAFGAFVWLRTSNRAVPVAPARKPADTLPGPDAGARASPAWPGGVPSRVTRPAPAGALPRVSTRDELVRVLKARGLDAEKLLARYQDWRVARGFLGADSLAGVTAENAPSQVYAAMDRITQKSLADSGDVGAIQAYAAGSLPGDPSTAIEYYSRATELGSAAAMAQIADIFADLGSTERGGNANKDSRQDAAAWALASIRLYGPILATPDSLALAEAIESSPDKAALSIICGRSLAIMADLSAATAGKDNTALPPVFITEKNLYERLPCRDTPVPVTPPRALGACRSSPALGSRNQPVELWICPEN